MGLPDTGCSLRWLSAGHCLIATIKILHVVLLFASPQALCKARDSTSGWQLMVLTSLQGPVYFVTQISLFNLSVIDLLTSAPSECIFTSMYTLNGFSQLKPRSVICAKQTNGETYPVAYVLRWGKVLSKEVGVILKDNESMVTLVNNEYCK